MSKYVQFGIEWQKEVMKLPKRAIVDMLARARLEIQSLEAAQQSVQADVCPSCGVDDWAYGDDTHTFEVCAMCGKRR